jgi:hypothetical protein
VADNAEAVQPKPAAPSADPAPTSAVRRAPPPPPPAGFAGAAP